jgi:hypothetical protein
VELAKWDPTLHGPPWRAIPGVKPDALKGASPVLNGGDEETGLSRPRLVATQRWNGLPVKLIDGSRLMIREYATRALIELMQIGQTPPGTDPVLHHTPEAFNRIEVVTTMRRQEIQPKLLVPVGERRRKLVRPMDATAVGHHDHLFAGVAKEGHHLMDILA